MELEEAIKILKEDLEHTKRANECGLATKGEFNKEIEAIEVVLNQLEQYKRLAEMNLKDAEEFKNNMCEHRCILYNEKEELKADLYEANNIISDYIDTTAKQEKMIELMLEYLNFYGVEDDICTAELSKDCNENCKECIKQYFEKKAEESE